MKNIRCPICNEYANLNIGCANSYDNGDCIANEISENIIDLGRSIKKFLIKKEIERLQDIIENGLRDWAPAWKALDDLIEITEIIIKEI